MYSNNYIPKRQNMINYLPIKWMDTSIYENINCTLDTTVLTLKTSFLRMKKINYTELAIDLKYLINGKEVIMEDKMLISHYVINFNLGPNILITAEPKKIVPTFGSAVTSKTSSYSSASTQTMTLTDSEGNQYVVPVAAVQPVHHEPEVASHHDLSVVGSLFRAIGDLADIGSRTVEQMNGGGDIGGNVYGAAFPSNKAPPKTNNP